MSKTIEELVDEKLIVLSDVMGVEIKFAEMSEEQGRVRPAYNPDAIISKFIALMVYSGLNVPSTFAPAYNRVHADIEYWKQHFQKLTEVQKTTEIQPPTEGT